MHAADSFLALAHRTLSLEVEGIVALHAQIGENFVEAVQAILQCPGRLVVTGIGKSALIGQKIVATMNSTGTPALFMHAADAIHGDLGMVQPGDVALCISQSGNSPEIKVLAPLLTAGGNTLIAMTGNAESALAKAANIVLTTTIPQEACPMQLAPTTSTTAQLALGDALAMCLLHAKGFTPQDFAKYHPGGALGKQLYLRVDELAKANEKPAVGPEATTTEVILEMTHKRLGATAVIAHDALIGIVTDGDLRRALEQHGAQVARLHARQLMNAHPKTIAAGSLATLRACARRTRTFQPRLRPSQVAPISARCSTRCAPLPARRAIITSPIMPTSRRT
jgi:arabinose-5-phosphate isomerase